MAAAAAAAGAGVVVVVVVGGIGVFDDSQEPRGTNTSHSNSLCATRSSATQKRLSQICVHGQVQRMSRRRVPTLNPNAQTVTSCIWK